MPLTAEEYFSHSLPDHVAGLLSAAADDVRAQEPLTVSYEIAGPDGGRYGLRYADGALTVVPGGVDGADLTFRMSAADWANTWVTAWEEPGADYYLRGKVKVLKGLRGTLLLELALEDGSEFTSATQFGDTAEPELTVQMTVADYAAMVKGALNGNMAFMTGKLKFDGSMALLMQLGALS